MLQATLSCVQIDLGQRFGFCLPSQRVQCSKCLHPDRIQLSLKSSTTHVTQSANQELDVGDSLILKVHLLNISGIMNISGAVCIIFILHVYACMQVCINVYTCINKCMYVRMFIYVYRYIHLYICVYLNIYRYWS